LSVVDSQVGWRDRSTLCRRRRTDNTALESIITDTDFVGVAINLLEQIEEPEPYDEEYEYFV
jgi:hypothetical protein